MVKIYLILKIDHNSSKVTILGSYFSLNNAIRSSMRKVYQLMGMDTKKLDNKWSWIDSESVITITEVPVHDSLDINSESPIPLFLRYKDFLEDIPKKDLENFRRQVINKKNLMIRMNMLKNKEKRLRKIQREED